MLVCKSCRDTEGLGLEDARKVCYTCRRVYKYDIMQELYRLQDDNKKLYKMYVSTNKKMESFEKNRNNGKWAIVPAHLILQIKELHENGYNIREISNLLYISYTKCYNIIHRKYKRKETIDFIDKIWYSESGVFEGFEYIEN